MRLLSICLVVALSPVMVSADPLTGRWRLNLAKTHYGPGAEPRKQETFACEINTKTLRCTIRSVRADGRTLVGRFAAAYDGRGYPTTGVPDVDQVSLRKIDEFVADATFSKNGRPVFGYRATKSRDGKLLTVVSVDPVSRAVLSSVVVYDRR